VPAQTVDDFFLLSTSVAPNVVLYLDVSSNMNQIEWHPSVRSDADASCTHWDNSTTYTFTSDDKNLVWCAATGAHKRTIYAPNNPTYWDGRLPELVLQPSDNSPILDQIETATVTPAGCNGAGSSTRFVAQYRRTRADAARQVFLDTLCLAEPRNIRFGLAEFRNNATDPNGAYISVAIENPSPAHASDTEAHVGNAGDRAVGAARRGHVPDLHVLHVAQRANIPYGKDGLTKFPAYTYDKHGDYDTGSGQLPDIQQYGCQKDFVIIVTTGLGTKDDFDVETPTNTANGFASFNSLIGDYYAENVAPLPNPTSRSRAPPTSARSTRRRRQVHAGQGPAARLRGQAGRRHYTIGFGTTQADFRLPPARRRRRQRPLVPRAGRHPAGRRAARGAERHRREVALVHRRDRSVGAHRRRRRPVQQLLPALEQDRVLGGPPARVALHRRTARSSTSSATARSSIRTAADSATTARSRRCARSARAGPRAWCRSGIRATRPARRSYPGTANSDTNARQLYVSKLDSSSPAGAGAHELRLGLTAADMKISTFTESAPRSVAELGLVPDLRQLGAERRGPRRRDRRCTAAAASSARACRRPTRRPRRTATSRARSGRG
jgi:hypothetical protein